MKNQQWYSLIKERIDRDKTELVYINPYQKTENAELISSNKKGYQGGNYYRYVKSIENYNEFDLIIIDGRQGKVSRNLFRLFKYKRCNYF